MAIVCEIPLKRLGVYIEEPNVGGNMEGRKDDTGKPRMDLIPPEAMVWEPVPNFEHYQVNNFGQIKNKDGKILKPYKNKWGYPVITLCKNSKKYRKTVHRIVCEAFLGPANGYDVNHKNTIKTDNRLINLEYVTRSQNEKHSWANGKKSRKHSAKITKQIATEIIKRKAKGESSKALALEFSISPQSVCDICKGRTWRKEV